MFLYSDKIKVGCLHIVVFKLDDTCKKPYESLIVMVRRDSACTSDRCRRDMIHGMLHTVPRNISQCSNKMSVTSFIISMCVSTINRIVVSYSHRGSQLSEDNRKGRCDRSGLMTTMVARKN